MRSLSANSYAILLQHDCPGIACDIATGADRLRAAVLWHFVHTTSIDALERMDDVQFKAACTAHGYALPPQELPTLFKVMTAELRAVNDAFVETETEGRPLEMTTPTSPTSTPPSSGSV
jgi:hypothetical protein